MSYKAELKNIAKQINELREKEREVEKWEQIESYEKRVDIIGKCYKNKKGNIFYKVIDLDISNEYRCFSLTFTKKSFDISDMEECLSTFRCPSFTENICGLGSIGVEVESIMIRDLINNMIEVSSEEFNEEYLNQCKKILTVDKFLLNDRLTKIKKEKEKNNE